jgi:tryptophan synthase alpha chain
MATGRIGRTFRKLNENGEAAFVPFVTVGDPDMGATESLVRELVDRGADLLELGVPFSDPMADGPTIQRSSARALQSGVSLPKVLRFVEKLRKNVETPIVLFGYANPFYRFGLRPLARSLAEVGVDGILCVDLPPEEAREFRGFLKEKGIDLVFLLAPTSNRERMKQVREVAGGFVYYVSVTGVTGARTSLDRELSRSVTRVKRFLNLPVGVGFGISTAAQARSVASFADAVIVGSALIDCWEQNLRSSDRVRRVGVLASELKRAIRGDRAR